MDAGVRVYDGFVVNEALGRITIHECAIEEARSLYGHMVIGRVR